MRRLMLALSAAIAAAALLIPAGANAPSAQPGHAATATAGDTTTVSSLAAPRFLAARTSAVPAVTTATCYYSYSFLGATGHFLCGTYVRGYYLVDVYPGTSYVYAFGIGTDRAVWWAIGVNYGGGWSLYSGWHSMGGVAVDGTWAWHDSNYNQAVQVRGTDYNLWCRYRPYLGSWGSWFMCNGWRANSTEVTFAGP